MSIRYKILCAFSVLVGLACILAFIGYRGVSRSDDLVVRLYDGPLMGINHARSAHAALNEARLLMLSSQHGEASGDAIAKFEALLTGITDDLDVVRERVQDDDVVAALQRAQVELREWSDTSLLLLKSPPIGDTKVLTSFLLAQKSVSAVAALDDLVETVAAYGFSYRMEAEASVVASRRTMLTLLAGIGLTGLMLAIAFAYSISKPISAAMHVAERVAAGIFTDRIETRRRDELGRLLQSLAVMQTSLKTRADEGTALMDRIVFLAHHDLLTGLFNRLQFTESLDDSILRLGQQGEAFSVLVLDLDRFKAVNDTLGHPIGDELLKQVAQRLQPSLRENEILARLGGDEFAIIQAAGPNQRQSAIDLSIRIDDVLSQAFDLSGNTVNIGTSIGIVMAPEHGAISSDLLRKADLALYRTKSHRKDCYTFFAAEMMTAVEARRAMEVELREAIEHDEFELHYQPVVDAKTLDICGVEALVRWHHPFKGLVHPDRFIPLAEETGLIVPIGEWILQQACADAAAWPENLTVAVNLSAVQFGNGKLFDVVLSALANSGLSPSRLELEITETVLLDNEQEFLTIMRQLKNLGISIALDDFGTGYSSMSYLTKFSFDKIKIDRSFTLGLGNRTECTAVISSVLTLARGLDIKVTAEGVETPEQFKLLQDAGVDLLQGYLFGRPVPVAALDLSGVPRVERAVEPDPSRLDLFVPEPQIANG
jgi:diguanylate cyclase (GGDEF)-like protein